MKLLFAGDLNFRGIEPLDNTQSAEILSEVQPYLEEADFRIVNLETPLACRDKHTPIYKSGPNLICMPENIAFLKTFGADAVTLANNHIGDFGTGAGRDTLRLLDEHRILYAGVGENTEEAYRPFILQKDGLSAAILSVCENEFGMATDESWGSAGYHPRPLLKAIRKAKENSDRVIVCFHGGNEFNPVPSPRTAERYRMICDMGADAVIAGHTHCPQGYEIYDGKPIVYSMGNFLFRSSAPKDPHDGWHYGYLCKLTIEKDISVSVIPYRFAPDAMHITVFCGEAREKMLEYIRTLSVPLSAPAMLASYFEGWSYLHPWCPTLQGAGTEAYNAAGNFNLVSCEAHCDQLRTILSVYHRGESENARLWAEKITEMQKMPV